LVVPEHDEAIAFYVGILGFTLIEDSFVPEQNKPWVVVAPPGSIESRLPLARASNPEQGPRIGNQLVAESSSSSTPITSPATTAGTWRKGFPFVREPKEESYGTVAVFRDPWGNLWDLLQPRSLEPHGEA